MGSLQYIVGYVVHKLYSKFKFSKNKDFTYSKQCLSKLLYCKIDSDDTETLINAKDWGGLWRVNETVENILTECEKIFRSFTPEFRLVIKYSELVQEMQANSIIISIYDSVCYNMEPKVNKELSLNLLESILELFVKVQMFSFEIGNEIFRLEIRFLIYKLFLSKNISLALLDHHSTVAEKCQENIWQEKFLNRKSSFQSKNLASNLKLTFPI